MRSIAQALVAAATLAAVGCDMGPHMQQAATTRTAYDFGGTLIYLSDVHGRVHAVESSGKDRWTYSLADALRKEKPDDSHDLEVREMEADEHDLLVVLATSLTGGTAGTTYLAAVEPTGQERWHRQVDGPSNENEPIDIGRDVYMLCSDGSLRAFSSADGHDLWRFAASGTSLGTPRVGSDQTIYIRGEDGRLHALSPDGTERWAQSFGE